MERSSAGIILKLHKNFSDSLDEPSFQNDDPMNYLAEQHLPSLTGHWNDFLMFKVQEINVNLLQI